MQQRKRTLLWIAAVSGTLLVLTLTLQFLAARFLDLGPVRERIQSTLSREIGGTVAFDRLEIAILPRPCVKAHQLRISLPGMVEGTAETLSIYPKILPLFTGDIRAAQTRIGALDLTVRLPGKPVRTGKASEPDTLAAVRKAVAAAGSRMASLAPGLAVVIQRGRVSILQERKPPLIVEDLDAQVVLPPQAFSIRVDCRTSFWKNLSLDARLDPQTLAAEGSLEVGSLRPHLLGPYLYPEGPAPVGDSLVNLDLSFKTDGARTFQAKGYGSAPHLRFQRSGQVLLIRNAQFKGSFQFDEQKTVITLDKLEAASPRLVLKGTMHRDERSPRADLVVTGSDIDIQALRQAVLFFAPDNRAVQGIFDVLRAGMVPAIMFESAGSTLSDLADLKRTRITAELQQGSIDIPGTPLHLTNVAGNAFISDGVLRGDRLTARLGNTSGQNGTLRLGLQEGDVPFHLDIMLQADLSQLPPVLKAFVSDRTFIRELDLLREVTGTASGRLVLGESTRSIKATVDVSSFELNAAYQRVPFPVGLRGGRFFYDEKSLLVEQVRGTFGKSSFTELTARLDLTAPRDLEITSAQSTLVLDELYSWLPTFSPVKKALMGIETVKGTALLSVQHAGLPLAKPGTVRFSASGSVKNVTIGSKDLPGPFTLAQGSFKADTDTITFTDTDAVFLDAYLRISGKLNGYLHSIQGGEATTTGTLGEEAVHWIAKMFSLPAELDVRPPLSVSQTRLAWQGKDTVSCAGTCAFEKGPNVTFDVVRDPQRLAVNGLHIQDGDSRADIMLKVERKMLDLTFAGALQEMTLKKIFTNEHVHHGRLSGKFQARVPLDRVQKATAHGTFEGEHLILPLQLKLPVVIDRISLKADGSRVTVGSANITIGDIHLVSSGTITAASTGYLIDGDVSSDKVNVDDLASELDKGKERGEDKPAQKKPQKNTWDLPLRGTVRFSAGSVSYGQWSAGPVRAAVDLDSNSIRAAVSEAALCGINLPGTVTFTPGDIALDLSPAAEQRDVASSMACLGINGRATGAFAVKGRLMAQGTPKTLLRSLQGTVEFTANDGSIYYGTVLVKILSFLSVNELVRGKLPDPAKDGVPFRTIIVKGTVQQGTLDVTEYSIDGPVVDIAGQGTIDLAGKTLDLTVVVAPLTVTTDIVKNLPGINYVLNGTLVTFPLRVKGPFDDVKVSYNPVTAVGKGVFGIMKRIVEIPLLPFESNKKGK